MRVGNGSWFVQEESEAARMDIGAMFEGCEPGDGYTMRVVEMTREELDALPEFEGF